MANNCYGDVIKNQAILATVSKTPNKVETESEVTRDAYVILLSEMLSAKDPENQKVAMDSLKRAMAKGAFQSRYRMSNELLSER